MVSAAQSFIDFIISPAYAAGTNAPTALDTLNALYASLNGLIALVTGIAFLSGIVMIVRGVMMLKSFGQHSNMMGQRGEMMGPIVYILVGSVLLYLPSALGVSFGTFFGGSSASTLTVSNEEYQSMLAYAGNSSSAQLQETMKVLLGYTKLIGLVAFVRGWHIISHAGNPGVQPGSITKGIVHLVGGILAMNVLEFANVLAGTMGYAPLF